MDPESAPRTLAGTAQSWWGPVLAVLLVVGAGAVALDGRTRAREDTAIASCQHDLGVATGYVEGRLGLVSHYLEPPLVSDGHVQQLHLADLMSARAGEVLPRVQRAARSCRRITLQPWHFAQVERQGAATAYAAALVTLVQAITAQGPTPFSDDGDLQRLRAAAGDG